ncbi:MAG: DNA-binding protein [Acidobacteriaceae bacterium]
MPERATTERAKEDLREGKSPSTAAGEFAHQEIEHVREGKHGARSPQQAIAIGLSKARRAGIPLPPPAKGKTKESTRKRAARDYRKGQSGETEEPSPRASRAREKALQGEPRTTASHRTLSSQSRRVSRQRSGQARHSVAMKAVQTKEKTGLRRAGKKAAHTRAKKG